MLANLDQQEAIIWLTITAIGSLFCFVGVWRSLSKYRAILDTPTSKIRSAPIGFVEFEGIAEVMPGKPIAAALTRTPCVWWQYRIERRSQGKKGPRWTTVDSGQSEALFWIKDNTGHCIVDPDGAVVTSKTSQTWYGNSADSTYGMPAALSVFGGRYRYTEQRLEAGDQLYVLGEYRSSHPRDSISLSELVHDRLELWKQNQDLLLAKFDENKDGEIDLDEWEEVRRHAKKEAKKQLADLTSQSSIDVISKPKNSKAFLLSNYPQAELQKKYLRGSGFKAVAFLILGAIAVRITTIHFL